MDRTQSRPEPAREPRGRNWYFAIFALSGFSGLIYESIWTQYIKLFLGHAAYAQTLVLAIFMGGMALGSWVASRYSMRWRNLLLGYAIVEGLVGAAALVFHHAFVGATDYAFAQLIPALGSPGLVQALKWGLSTAFILPQSILLGMTFPLMSGGIMRRFRAAPGHTLALLYFSNSFGAALGVLTGGFALIGLVGLPGTMLTAGLINVGLALAVWLMASGNAAPPLPAVQAAGDGQGTSWWLRVVLVAAFVTGAASFIYEIAWIRMLSLVLGSSTHSFELMLSAFILGLAFGGLWIRKRIDALGNPVRFLAYVQIAMGLLALLTIALYDRTFDLMAFALSALSKNEQGYALYHVSSHLISLLVMLPATFCAGMTLPLMTNILLGRGVGERSIGAVYGANTLGAIAGVFLAVHVLMPALSVKGAIGVGAGLDIVLGVGLLAACMPAVRRFEPLAGGVLAGLAAVLVLALSTPDERRVLSGVFRDGQPELPDDVQVLFHRDGKTATVGVLRWPTGVVTINTNGKPDAGIMMGNGLAFGDESTMVFAGALPLAFHPQAKLAANIGFGSGLTTHTLLSTPQLTRVDTIEIEPAMVQGARHFLPHVRNAYEDPRSRIHIEDAKTFFSKHRTRYDIIVSEPSNPWVSGVASLFSEEFYARVNTHLAPEGVFVQWLQLYETDPALLASVMKALSPHFADYVVFNANDSDMLIVAKAQGKLPALDAATLRQPGLARELARLDIHTVEDLAARKLAGKAVLDPMFASYGVPPNSDYFPYVDQHAAKARFVGTFTAGLSELRLHPLPLLEMAANERRPGAAGGAGAEARAAAAAGARALRDAIVSGRYEQVPGSVQRSALLPALLLTQCSSGLPDSAWVDTLQRLGETIVPHLSKEELEPVWKRLEGAPCFARLTDKQREWYLLVRSVGRRDGVQMAGHAKKILSSGWAARSPQDARYAVMAGVLGHVSKGTPGQGFVMWLNYGQKVLPLEAIDARLLIGMTATEKRPVEQVAGHAQPAAPPN